MSNYRILGTRIRHKSVTNPWQRAKGVLRIKRVCTCVKSQDPTDSLYKNTRDIVNRAFDFGYTAKEIDLVQMQLLCEYILRQVKRSYKRDLASSFRYAFLFKSYSELRFPYFFFYAFTFSRLSQLFYGMYSTKDSSEIWYAYLKQGISVSKL